MLQVLAELDGIKNVSDIAAGLNKQVSELVTTFATLYQQKLILSVKPNQSVIDPPPSKLDISYNLKKINDGNLKSSSLPRQRSKLNKQPFKLNLTEKRALRSKRYAKEPKTASYLHSLGVSGDSDSHLQNTIAAEKRIFEFKTNSNSQKRKRNPDIFRIDNPKQIGSSRAFDTPFPSGRSKAYFKGKNESIYSESNEKIGFSNEKTLEYFEKGLSFLKRRSYKEALHQFEKALELDPQNRLCRANIKRIRKILFDDSNS
jgi:tetratricopeptide (TPR) repeat protein